MKISPSIMCARPWDVKTYVEKFEQCGIPMIHYDVMDGNYVPNISVGTGEYADIHDITNLPLDLHLMVQNPDVAVDYFKVLPGDYVSFHPDTIDDPASLLKKIHEKGAKAGVAISPKISLDYVQNLIENLDFVLMMSVEPGFAGQRMLPEAVEKVGKLAQMKAENNWDIEIFVDGDCAPKNARKVIDAGATGCVVGSALINKNNKAEDFAQTLNNYLAEFNA